MVHIFYTKFEEKLKSSIINKYLGLLPDTLQKKNLKYRRWQDRHAHLFGKLLLLEGFKRYGFFDNVLSKLQFNEYSRPYIEGNIDFNISHSGIYVICAIGKEIKVGVDIEEIKKVEFNDFKMTMTDEQWESIYQSANPLKSFFRYWTKKESIIKADSRGLSIPLLDIHIKNNLVQYENQIWYLNEIFIDESYCSYIATNKNDISFKLIKIDFGNSVRYTIVKEMDPLKLNLTNR